MVMPLVSNWEKDLVYLIQLPRVGCVPSLSPFALKLETWLRMADISYQNLNGRQIADTNIIIDELTKIFHIQMDDQLVEPTPSDGIAFTIGLLTTLFSAQKMEWGIISMDSENLFLSISFSAG
uniref:Uncharacterized protein n=1 Tax=Ditylenchus dipsaci TaxID=166011 RepID=A0A915DBB1_9BILA